MSVVEPRYAEALYKAAPPEDINRIDEILRDFSTQTSESAELRLFLLNPSVPAHVLKETLRMLLPVDVPESLIRFFSVLIDRKRLDKLPGISAEFNKIKNRERNRLVIRVTSAQPLDDIQLARIKEICVRKYNAGEAELRQETDPFLLGGMRIQIGDKTIDRTLRARINGLRNSLKKEVAQWV